MEKRKFTRDVRRRFVTSASRGQWPCTRYDPAELPQRLLRFWVLPARLEHILGRDPRDRLYVHVGREVLVAQNDEVWKASFQYRS
jgi:hypothetical protein